jgi:hypothetical protein
MQKSSIDLAARALRHAFGPDDQLYRDHRGHRVLADLEGSGDFRIERTTVSLQIESDGRLFESPGSFAWSLLISTAETGPASVAVRTGRPCGEDRVASLPLSGCGWVVRAEGPFHVDGRHEAAPSPDEFLAVPYFIGVEGAGSVRIVAVPAVEARLLDAFDVDDEAALRSREWRVQNISKVSELASCFPDGTERVGPVASHLNAASWRCPIPEGCLGLRLRRYYDRFHGRQRARVLVDGQVVGWWYDPAQDRSARWAISEFGIPSEFLTDGSVEITIDPPAGAPLWSVGRIEIYGIVPVTR